MNGGERGLEQAKSFVGTSVGSNDYARMAGERARARLEKERVEMWGLVDEEGEESWSCYSRECGGHVMCSEEERAGTMTEEGGDEEKNETVDKGKGRAVAP